MAAEHYTSVCCSVESRSCRFLQCKQFVVKFALQCRCWVSFEYFVDLFVTVNDIPMRPIVSFCGSPTYQLSKYLPNVLKPLTDESTHKLQSTENFIDVIKTIQIPDDHKLVSFDVKSLFTSIPLQLALDCTENAIKNSTVELPLPTDDIMDLLNLCLTSTYFQHNRKHYKQLHSTAMGSPDSVVVADINCHAEHRGTSPSYLHVNYTSLVTLR